MRGPGGGGGGGLNQNPYTEEGEASAGMYFLLSIQKSSVCV